LKTTAFVKLHHRVRKRLLKKRLTEIAQNLYIV